MSEWDLACDGVLTATGADMQTFQVKLCWNQQIKL